MRIMYNYFMLITRLLQRLEKNSHIKSLTISTLDSAQRGVRVTATEM
jgi:hypothetical protein